jgi:hypothetical protein
VGPELETYKGNKIVMAIVAILALWPAYIVYNAFTTSSDKVFWASALLLMAVPGCFFVWLRYLQVSLHSDGICYRSLLEKKEMRWEEVERFYFEATKRSINFIPVGTYYLYKLVDAGGKKIEFGNRIERPRQLGQKLIEQTYPALYQKVADRFNNGQDLDFGAIRVSKAGGIKVKKLFGYKEIPWDQVSSYAIQKGNFYIWRKGEKRTTGWGLRRVPNAFVLLGLLNAMFKPSSAR